MAKKVQNLVADAGAFILQCPLQDFGDTIYTLTDVVNEIKDEKTRNSLSVLPYDLKFRLPTDDDIKFVAHFSKKTGDFAHLSVTDIRLIALTVRLEKEFNPEGSNIRTEPEIKIVPTGNSNSNALTVKDLECFGYDLKNKQKEGTNCIDDSSNPNDESQDSYEIQFDSGKVIIEEEEGWITQDNYQDIQQKIMGITLDEDDDDGNDLEKPTQEIKVACITGDYAVQNVLLQMGLNVISPKDGLQIKHTRQYILRCHACARINPPTATMFCKYCGNCRTLKRVAITINQDGTVKLHINFRKPIRIRGTKYSLPMPKGGKHANNPILCEDQRVPQQRKSKLAVQEKKMLNMNSILTDPDYLARSNPFAINDVYSRGSRFNTRQRNVVNPNETRKPTGNKKKKSNRF